MHRCGIVTIAGRPNVGKSTLLNYMIGTKVAIVTPKPQTTRDRITGIRTEPDVQYLFQDTPGLHKPMKALNRRMVAEAEAAISDADVVLFMTDAASPKEAEDLDREWVALVAGTSRPVVLALNKVDRLDPKSLLLPIMDFFSRLHHFEAIIPICALTGDGVDRLLEEVKRLLPEGPALYPEETLSDRPIRFLAAEVIREKLTLATAKEIPYSVAVTIDDFQEPEPPEPVRIFATIHCERESQKPIVIGRGGAMLRRIGTEARRELELLLSRHVFLKLYVKVSEDWTRTDRGLDRILM